MNEMITNKKQYARGLLGAGVVVASLAGGYALRGTTVGAQQTDQAVGTKTPIVETAATRDAVSMQHAFNLVSKAIEPAVVTITTERALRPTSGHAPRMQPFDPFGDGSGSGNGQDPFQEFFKQFRNFGFQPNSAQRAQMRARFYQIQSAHRSGGLGSGMIYRSDGIILTNAHVVSGADTVTVKLNDGREFRRAKVLGIDERTDVAVVKINATHLPAVQLADSSQVEVGDWAIACGNPFGLDRTLTVGVISAKAREVPLNESSPGDYLQTDASINPGNSGGPLCDIYGRVVGINNAIYSESGGNIGIGFAVPINTAREIADKLIANGKITRGYLGITIGTLEQDEGAKYGLDPHIKGVLVEDVKPNTPGARAGLQAGDVIQEFNGHPVTRSAELQRIVGEAPVNSTAQLKVLRDNRTVTLTARLEELKPGATDAGAEGTPAPSEDANPAPTALGLRLRALTPELARRFGLKATQGVVVVGVEDNSPAGAAGIEAGDIIERVAQTPVTTPQQMQAAVNNLLSRQSDDNKGVALYVNHKGERHFVVVDVSK